MAPAISLMHFAAILTFLFLLRRCSGIKESCKRDSHRTLEWQSYKQIATVAGSYIPGDLYWNRPQYSLAPCFKVERNLRAFAGCPSKVQMTLDNSCARHLFNSANEYAAQFPIYVSFPKILVQLRVVLSQYLLCLKYATNTARILARSFEPGFSCGAHSLKS